MNALPWYFGSPSEVRLTQASCCDGLHYGVYGLWGSAPTSPAGKCPSLTVTTCRTPQLQFTCCSEDNELFEREIIPHSKSTVRNKHIMCLNIHHFHCNGISYPTTTTTLKVNRDFDPSHGNHCSPTPFHPWARTQIQWLPWWKGVVLLWLCSQAAQ